MKQRNARKLRLFRAVMAPVFGGAWTVTMWWVCWRDYPAFILLFGFVIMSMLFYFTDPLTQRLIDAICRWAERGNKSRTKG